MYNLLILILSVYGMSKLLVDYDGPFGIFYTLRNHVGALNCTVCTSVYVAILFSVLLALGWYWFITVFAVVGAIIFVEQRL